MLSYKLDFNSCAIRDGFCKSSHIYMLYVLSNVTLSFDSNSPSSIIVTTCICIPSEGINTPQVRDDWSIVTLNDSFPSSTSSSIIEMLKEALICPAGIVTIKGPGI